MTATASTWKHLQGRLQERHPTLGPGRTTSGRAPVDRRDDLRGLVDLVHAREKDTAKSLWLRTGAPSIDS
jgi:hypothetical protein